MDLLSFWISTKMKFGVQSYPLTDLGAKKSSQLQLCISVIDLSGSYIGTRAYFQNLAWGLVR